MNLLYIESDDEFRLEVTDLLKEFFNNIYVSNLAKNSIELFKEHHPQVIIIDIDIHVYYFDWLKIARHMKEIHPEVKIILLSMEDKKKNFLDAIDVGVTKFLEKPIEPNQLSDAIQLAINQIDYEKNRRIFYTYIHSLFNYRKTMIMMMKDDIPILVNYIFLEFFGVESIHEFNRRYKDLGDLFLYHKEYLYNTSTGDWLNIVSKDTQKQYHVQIKNKDDETRHFILKYHEIEEEESYSIISLDDITKLLSSKNHTDINEKMPPKEERNNILKSLALLKRNEVKVHMYNYYKGLTIVHDAFITDVKKDSVSLKTDFLQQKAIQIEGKSLISSEVIPYTIACNKVSNISYEKQTVELENIHISQTSPATRKTIRLEPEKEHKVYISINKKEVAVDIKIVDISFDSVQLKFDKVPALHKYDKVLINMILICEDKPLVINTKATVVKETAQEHNSSVAFVLKLSLKNKELMLKYISARQIELIREFKALKDK